MKLTKQERLVLSDRLFEIESDRVDEGEWERIPTSVAFVARVTDVEALERIASDWDVDVRESRWRTITKAIVAMDAEGVRRLITRLSKSKERNPAYRVWMPERT